MLTPTRPQAHPLFKNLMFNPENVLKWPQSKFLLSVGTSKAKVRDHPSWEAAEETGAAAEKDEEKEEKQKEEWGRSQIFSAGRSKF